MARPLSILAGLRLLPTQPTLLISSPTLLLEGTAGALRPPRSCCVTTCPNTHACLLQICISS